MCRACVRLKRHVDEITFLGQGPEVHVVLRSGPCGAIMDPAGLMRGVAEPRAHLGEAPDSTRYQLHANHYGGTVPGGHLRDHCLRHWIFIKTIGTLRDSVQAYGGKQQDKQDDDLKRPVHASSGPVGGDKQWGGGLETSARGVEDAKDRIESVHLFTPYRVCGLKAIRFRPPLPIYIPPLSGGVGLGAWASRLLLDA
jgi:hypothetical protein